MYVIALFGGGWCHIAAGPGEEGGEVGLGVVAVGVLAKGEVAGDE